MVPMKLGLGYIVWWSLPDKISVMRSEWPERFGKDFGIPMEPLGDVLRRALYAIKAPEGSKRLIRPLQAHDEWGLVIESYSDGESPLVYDFKLSVKLSPVGLEIALGDQQQREFIQELKTNYEVELERVTPGCVADIVLRGVRGNCLAVQARKTGGVYFVTADYHNSIQRIANFVLALGGNMYWFPINETPQAKKDLLKLVVEDLKNSIEIARANIAARHKTDAVSEGTAALDRVRYYREALGMAAGQAKKIEKELNRLLVEALTKKEKGGK